MSKTHEGSREARAPERRALRYDIVIRRVEAASEQEVVGIALKLCLSIPGYKTPWHWVAAPSVDIPARDGRPPSTEPDPGDHPEAFTPEGLGPVRRAAEVVASKWRDTGGARSNWDHVEASLGGSLREGSIRHWFLQLADSVRELRETLDRHTPPGLDDR